TAPPASCSTRTTSRTSRRSRAATPTPCRGCSRTCSPSRIASSASSRRRTWKRPGPSSGPERSVMTNRHLARAACAGLLLALFLPWAASAQEGFGKNKIQYKHFKWNIYHAPHFDVYYYDAEDPLLERTVSFAESAYDELSRRFDYQIESSTPLIFYRTHNEFEQNNIELGFIDEAVGAFATDIRFRMVLPVDLPDAELHQLIRHELTHIFQYHILFNGHIS